MAGNDSSGKGNGGTKKPSDKEGKRAKKVTFVYSNDGKILLGQHATNACSISTAFDEFRAGKQDMADAMLVGAIPGHHEFMKDHIRKPTYDELQAMLANMQKSPA